MTWLKVYSDQNQEECLTSSDPKLIAEELNRAGIDFEQWNLKQNHSEDIARIKSQYGFKAHDIIKMSPDTSAQQIKELRAKFLQEHTHSDDEVRFFIEGRSLFCIHKDHKVFMITCEAGDFIAIPADTKHWFDMGSCPNFTCIRFFSNETGWIANYTGDSIAEKYPKLNQ